MTIRPASEAVTNLCPLPTPTSHSHFLCDVIWATEQDSLRLLVYLLIIRPGGFVSKKTLGAASSAESMVSCSFLAARCPMRAVSTPFTRLTASCAPLMAA